MFGEKAPKVCVALATFNGQKYIGELLDSIARQSWKPIEVVASDDASTDSTLMLLNEFKTTMNLKLVAGATRGGVISNFNRALGACDADYIALADQDDVWQPEKIAVMMGKLLQIEQRHGKKSPALVFCNLEIVNERLEGIPPFHFFSSVSETEGRQNVADLLLRNHVPGCSMLFNRALLSRAMPVPETFYMHDWWLALVAASFGRVAGVDAALVKYRQHSSNVAGFETVVPAAGARLMSPNVWREFLGKSRRRAGIVSRNLQLFEERFADELPDMARLQKEFFKRCFTSFIHRARYLKRTGSGLNVWTLLAMCSDKPARPQE